MLLSFTEGDTPVPGSGEGRRGFFLSDVGESLLSVMDSHCDRLEMGTLGGN